MQALSLWITTGPSLGHCEAGMKDALERLTAHALMYVWSSVPSLFLKTMNHPVLTLALDTISHVKGEAGGGCGLQGGHAGLQRPL